MGHRSYERAQGGQEGKEGLNGLCLQPRSAEFKTELQADTFNEFDPILLLFSDASFPSNSDIPFISVFTQSHKGLIFGWSFFSVFFDAKAYQSLGSKEKVVRVPKAEFPIAKKGMLPVQQA